MTITKVESFQYAGKLYDTELKAVEAAIQDIAAKIMKEFSGSIAVGVIHYRDELIPLLDLHRLSNPRSSDQ